MSPIENLNAYRWLGRGAGISLLAAIGFAAFHPTVDRETAFGLNNMLHFANGAVAAITAILFFFILKPINGAAAGLATLLRLIAAGFSIYAVLAIVQLATDGNSATDLLDRIETIEYDAFHWGLVASSLAAAITYAVMFAGRIVPRVLSGYGFFASIGAAIGAGSIYVLPALNELMFPAYVAANGLAFVSLVLWLIIFGVDGSRVGRD